MLRSKIAAALALALLVLSLSGCGSAAPPAETAIPAPADTVAPSPPFDVAGEETAPVATEPPAPVWAPPEEGSLTGSYYNDFLHLTLTLSEDGSAALQGGAEDAAGTYTAADGALVLELAGKTLSAAADDDGDLTLEGYSGYFLRDWDKWGITAEELGLETPDGENAPAAGSDNGDGSLRYRDFDHAIAFTYPAGMTVEAGKFLGAAGVSDGNGGWVVGRNVTEVYRTHIGSNDEFLEDYVKTFVFADFELIGGSVMKFENFNLRHEGINGRLADGSVRIGSADGEWDAHVILYTSTYADGTVNYICKTVLVPAGESVRMENLAAAVRDMGAVRLVAG
jgi:hypothetical protein